jgi:excisionase family DNA binding protein
MTTDDLGELSRVPVLLTVRDAAALLGVGRTTTYELIASGELEVVHISRAARIPTESVAAYVQRLRTHDRAS